MTTYYVDGAVGDDANDGLAEGAGNAWATIDHAMNNVVAGDKVWVKASGTYDENANIDTAGTAALPIVFEGYSSTTGDGGRPVWGNTAGSALTATATTSSYYVFKHFDFNGSSSSGVICSFQFVFYDCYFRNNGGDGVEAGGLFLNCEAYSNTQHGMNLRQGDTQVIGCKVYGNAWSAISLNARSFVYKTVCYGGSNLDLIANPGHDEQRIVACTLDGNSASNALVDFTNRRFQLLAECILYDRANGAISTDVPQNNLWNSFVGYNLLNSNTIDYNGFSGVTGLPVGLHDVSGAPAFTDEAGDDYTLDASSPAINAGIQPGVLT